MFWTIVCFLFRGFAQQCAWNLSIALGGPFWVLSGVPKCAKMGPQMDQKRDQKRKRREREEKRESEREKETEEERERERK